MDEGRYSVICHFADGSSQCVYRDASVEETVEAFGFFVSCFGARIGSIQRVEVTNHEGMVSLEWIFGKGITRKPVVGLKVDAGVPASEHV
jgi:hypothetical protein